MATKKCNKGYPCGNACISRSKVCTSKVSRANAAIVQELLQRAGAKSGARYDAAAATAARFTKQDAIGQAHVDQYRGKSDDGNLLLKAHGHSDLAERIRQDTFDTPDIRKLFRAEYEKVTGKASAQQIADLHAKRLYRPDSIGAELKLTEALKKANITADSTVLESDKFAEIVNRSVRKHIK